MKLGLYYHIPMIKENGQAKITSLFGVFIDQLAKNCTTLFLFLHEATQSQKEECDYQLQGKNIEWVNLGFKNPAWSRDLFHRFKLNKYKKALENLDALIVRSPTPYAPYFHHYIDKKKIVYFIVGDYGHASLNFKTRNFRDVIIKKYIAYNDQKFSKVLVGANIIVNSNELFNKYESFTQNIILVRTTTLRESDFYQRSNTCEKEPITLLYTGRIDMAKGLVELIESTSLLKNYKRKIITQIVGWDTDKNQMNLLELQHLAKKLGIEDRVEFLGKKSVGEELNKCYRQADIYVFPTYFEGFPRTIWEAMANSLPIVTTPVGGIPFVLKEKIHAVFAQPKSAQSLKEAIQLVVEDQTLRARIIQESYITSQSNTIDKQTEFLVAGIKKFVH